MEASKCPKCGEEPQYLEHVEKWYCYGCNSYIEEGAEEHVCDSEHPKEACASAIEKELKALNAAECKKCGASLQDLKDGRLYCFMCETYQDEIVDEPAHEVPAEPHVAAEASPPPVAETPVAEQPVPEASPAPTVVILEPPQPSPEARPEPPAEPAIEVKSCPTCGQPLKFIAKYQRHYCYGCRKYAPKEGMAAPEEHPSKPKCPDCGSELKFIEKYNEHYCYACKKYPLRQSKKPVVEVKDPPKPQSLTCAKCGQPLKLIAKYNRLYCHGCKEYAPKGPGQGIPTEKKVCPLCKSTMKFIPEYNEWYCYKCRKYSLRPSKPILLL
jgi:uncharacterized Zn finger protein (UPF0148 family)